MSPALEAVVSFLFKYPPEVFERGRLVFGGTLAPVVVLGLIAAAVPVVASYRRVEGTSRAAHRGALAAIRVALIGLLAFCLSGPALELASAVPQRNFVAVLIDDSRSMRIADVGGRARGEEVGRLFGRDSTLMRALASRFQLRYFRFSGSTERIEDPSSLGYAGARTRIAPALERVREELAQVPVAGIVVVSDGADNGVDSATTAVAGAPVYAVGIGAERFDRDIELTEVHAPTVMLQGSTMAVDLIVSQTGYSGRSVTIRAEAEGRLLGTRDVKLGPDGTSTPVRMLVPAPDPGHRTLRFSISPGDGEVVPENNRRDAMVSVRQGPDRILYYEGEPRFETKFLRRAVAEDANLHLVTLQRTAEQKYLRLGVADSLELVSGFPRTREELFAYRAVILGSVEASALSVDQLRMIADFVSIRGGGLLVLGGRRSFAEGGYAGTPLAEALPVTLGKADTSFFSEMRVRPTSAGAAHPAVQLAGEPAASAARWRTLPPLTTVNRVTGTKPGATVLLDGTGDNARQPALAFQRYGRGRTIALAVQDTWLWQMHADIPVDDRTHETLWQQLLRWLVSETPDPVMLVGPIESVMPEEPVTIAAEVRNFRFDAVNDAPVVAHVTSPSGIIRDIPLAWAGARDGEYRGTFVPDEEGRHEVAVSATTGGGASNAAGAFHVGDSDAELSGATMRAPLLRRLAEASGGRFYTPATVSSLPDDIAISGAGVTVRELRDLWDMPAVFLVLVSLLGAEWTFRRRRGLA